MSSQDIFSSDFQDFWIHDVLQGASTVKRESKRQDYLWDTHGNYEGFLFNMRKLWLIDSKWNWSGENRHLVLLGDIYADRNLGSLQTAQHIEKLIAQGAQIRTSLLAIMRMRCWAIFTMYIHQIFLVSATCVQDFYEDGPRIDAFSGLQYLSTYRKGTQNPSWQKLLIGTKPWTILERMRALKSDRKSSRISVVCR